MWMAPGRAPCSYSSGSRTSSTTVPGRPTSSAAVGGVDLTDPGLGVTQQVAEARHSHKSYRAGRHSAKPSCRSASRPATGRSVGRGARCRPFAGAACAGTFRTDRCRPRWSTGSSTGPGGRRRPGTPRAGRSWCSRAPSRPGASGRPTPTRPGWPDPTTPGCSGPRCSSSRFCSRQAYLDRYAEPDKAAAGLAVEDRLAGALLAGRHRLRHHAAAPRGGRGGLGRPVLRAPRRSGPAARRVRRARRLGAHRRGRPRVAGAGDRPPPRRPRPRPPAATRSSTAAGGRRAPARRRSARRRDQRGQDLADRAPHHRVGQVVVGGGLGVDDDHGAPRCVRQRTSPAAGWTVRVEPDGEQEVAVERPPASARARTSGSRA